MREMQVALSNTVRMLDIVLTIIDHDIEMLTEIEKVDDTKTETMIEKIYKNHIRSEIVNMKKDFIHCIELEHAKNTKNKQLLTYRHDGEKERKETWLK